MLKNRVTHTALTLVVGLHFFTYAQASQISVEDYRQGVVSISQGNTLSQMPDLPKETVSLINQRSFFNVSSRVDAEALGSFKDKYWTVVKSLKKNYENSTFSLRAEVLTAAKLYKIDPAHILSAIIGEHVFNVGITDGIQDLLLKSNRWQSKISEKNEFVKYKSCPEMRKCDGLADDYDTMACYESTWHNELRGRQACSGVKFVNHLFVTEFFNPSSIGTTYGLGQLGPIKILSLSDMVSRVSGFPHMTLENQKLAYQAALDPKMTVHFIAATMRKNIDLYKQYARFDISKNVGLTATLYNIGKEKERAQNLFNKNLSVLSSGGSLIYPQVNYYGWFVNELEPQIREDFKLPR